MNIADLTNKVLQGDCLEEMKKIPSNSIDMVLCDLPYGTTQNKWDSIIPLEDLKPFGKGVDFYYVLGYCSLIYKG